MPFDIETFEHSAADFGVISVPPTYSFVCVSNEEKELRQIEQMMEEMGHKTDCSLTFTITIRL